MNLLSQLESILFVASRPLTMAQLAKATGKSEGSMREAIETLQTKWNRDDSGVHILVLEDGVRMGTNAENAAIADQFVKDEIAGELTKAQLETLTVIAYCGPITRPELDEIRGVNCALILRNLSIRGLVETHESKEHALPTYTLSFEALRHLGIRSVEELPEFEILHHHEHVLTTRTE